MLAVMPCLRALNFAVALPRSVIGPVDFCALRRFASICFWLAIVGSFLLRKCEKAGSPLCGRSGLFYFGV